MVSHYTQSLTASRSVSVSSIPLLSLSNKVFSRKMYWVAGFSSLLLTLTGAISSATAEGIVSQAAQAELNPDQQLLAQQIVDGLPPPPAGFYGVPTLPPAQLQPSQPYPVAPSVVVPAPVNPSVVVPAPTSSGLSPSTPSIAPGITGQRYLVLVNGDSPLLLEQVRKVESGAFLQTYEGQRVIQAGAFLDPTSAQRQVQILQSQGIGAEVITATAPVTPMLAIAAPRANQPQSQSNEPLPELVPVRTTPTREIVFGQQPYFDGSGSVPSAPSSTSADPSLIAAANSYYVVIPARSSELPEINDQVVRLGEGLQIAQVVEERRSPLGPHVLVGPFVNRGAAERWNDYLRAFGMDARVYYRR